MIDCDDDDLFDGKFIHCNIKLMKFAKKLPDPHVPCKPKQIYLVPSEMRSLIRIRYILKKKSYLY